MGVGCLVWEKRGRRKRNCRISNGQIRDPSALRRKRGLANISEGTLPTFWDCNGRGGGGGERNQLSGLQVANKGEYLAMMI